MSRFHSRLLFSSQVTISQVSLSLTFWTYYFLSTIHELIYLMIPLTYWTGSKWTINNRWCSSYWLDRVSVDWVRLKCSYILKIRICIGNICPCAITRRARYFVLYIQALIWSIAVIFVGECVCDGEFSGLDKIVTFPCNILCCSRCWGSSNVIWRALCCTKQTNQIKSKTKFKKMGISLICVPFVMCFLTKTEGYLVYMITYS